MEKLLQDIRYGMQLLARKPGFTALAVLTLALGIGANTAIFSMVNAVLLRPLPFSEPGQIVQLNMTEEAPGNFPLTGQDFLDWRAQNRTFADMAVYTFTESYNVTGAGEPERANVVETQANFFSMLGVQPIYGRPFLNGEDTEGKNRVALLSYAFWQRQYAGQVSAINTDLQLNGEPYHVVGIMPAWYRVPGGADLWVPIDMSPKKLGPRGEHHLRAIGRVKSGVTIEQARADLLAISTAISNANPSSNYKVVSIVTPLREQLIGNFRTQLWLMFGAVGAVLLIACANVANLLLARATDRRREIAVRTAMGAERGRIVRQLLTESVMLAVLGAVPGIGLAYTCLTLLVSAKRLPFPQPNPVGVNWMVLLFTLGVSVVIGLLFGLAPAVQTSRVNLIDELRASGKMVQTASASGRAMRNVLVTVEIALSLALLAGAALLLRTFSNLRNVQVGINAEHVLTAGILPPDTRYPTPAKELEFYNRLLAELQAMPGVQGAAITSELPIQGGSNGYVVVDGKPASTSKGVLVQWAAITPDYFRVMGVPVLEGRALNAKDVEEFGARAQQAFDAYKAGKNNPVFNPVVLDVVINQTMAKKFWPGEDPIGRQFHQSDDTHFRVAGVVGDIREWGLRTATPPEAYFALTRDLFGGGEPMNIAVLGAGRPELLASGIRTAVRNVDSTLAVYDVRTIKDITSDSMATDTNETFLLGVFAGLALLLAAVGTYGVMSYLVTQRTGEIGIRVALGASRGEVLWLVVKQGLTLAAIGSALGVAGAIATSKLLQQMLFGVKPNDPVTLASVCVLMIVVSLVATLVPAMRAMRVEPIVALRYE